MTIETTILSNLINNEAYSRKVIAYISDEYFDEAYEKYVFFKIKKFMDKYGKLPEKVSLEVEMQGDPVSEDIYNKSISFLEKMDGPVENIDWLVDETEKFCQDRALYNAIHDSIGILDGDDKKRDKGIIPELLSDALAVSFDSRVGHDYFEDADERYEYYNRIENKIDFDLKILSKITKGGVSKKSLTIFMAATGVGKSLVMCHCAAGNLMHGKNVLYITMEMAEEEISKRIDANLLNITMDELDSVNRDIYKNRLAKMKAKTKGKLIVKEYPTGSANVNHFRYLLRELKIKKGFIPDIIYIDYINICSSSRFKNSDIGNSYSYIKAIAEEIRGLAVEEALPIISATQTNREGYGNSDVDLTNVSESIGLPQTADLMLALMTDEELEIMRKIMFKQLKNRYAPLDNPRRFAIGIDRSMMRLYDVEDSSQEDIIQETSVMDNTPFGERDREERNGIKSRGRRKR